MFDELETVTIDLEKEMPRTVIITGAGDKSFSAGFDVNPDNPMVKRIFAAVTEKNEVPAREAISRLREVVDRFVSLPVPLIAAINGSAYGGGAEIASRCDLRIMDERAVICFSEVTLGLMPDWGGGAALARLIGSSRAADLILTARKVTAAEAFSLGFANRVSNPGETLADAKSIAIQIASNGPRSVRHALSVLRNSRNLSYDTSLDDEKEKAISLIVSGECVHGVSAFLGKKKPVFPDI
jgi:enoyl-CoA hydratase